MVFVFDFHKTEGLEQFFTDVLKCFNIENPVFVSTDESDQDFTDIAENSTTALIRYVTNKEEREVASHLSELYFLGDLTVVVFLDDGHRKLLDLLINDLQLLKKGLTGIISEADVNSGLNLTLQLDTKLFLYSTEGATFNVKEMYRVLG